MSERSASRWSLLLVGLLVLTSVVGVGLLVGDTSGEQARRPRADDAAAQLQSLDGFAATRRTVIERGNETHRTVDRISRRLRGAGGAAIRVERVSGPGLADLIVANGSVRWHYDRDAGVATRYNTSGGPTGGFGRIPRLLTRLDRSTVTAATPTGTPGVSPLPVVPAAGANASVEGPVTAGNGAFTVTAEGTATVDGRRTYVVRLTQATTDTEPVGNYTQTLWLDSERYVPLKRRTAWTQGGERTVVTTTYTNVTFDPGFEPGTFAFEPPTNATVERPDTPRRERYDSLGALRSAASMSVPAPDLPADFALASATRTHGRRITTVGLRYVNATATVEVAKLEPVYRPRTDGERVTVAGRHGTYRNLGPEQSVVWACNGTQYKVSTTGLGRAGTVELAGSVRCR